jgi:hypothetical protein
MKIVVYPNQATLNPLLDGYVLQSPWTNIPANPDFFVSCGHAWFGSAFNPIFTVGSSGKFYCVIDGNKIICFKPPLYPEDEAQVLYQHNTWIRRLAIRMVNGVERLYFSADSPTAADAGRKAIYWLDGNHTPHVYWNVSAKNLQVPNPCNPGQDIPLFYIGDFTFGTGNTLYLSNGNSTPGGLFKVTGATATAVSGTPQRFFVTDSYCMSDLQFDGSNGLLFTDYTTDQSHLPYRLRRFDLTTGTVTTIWNTSGTIFRGFALYPVSKTAHLEPSEFDKFIHFDFDHLKRDVIKIDPAGPIERSTPSKKK